MIKNKKKIFKVCPSCKFDKCWYASPKCEKCSHNFQKVKKTSASIEATDDDLDFLNEPPKVVAPVQQVSQTTKRCPKCNGMVYYKSKICELCKYDFYEVRVDEAGDFIGARRIVLLGSLDRGRMFMFSGRRYVVARNLFPAGVSVSPARKLRSDNDEKYENEQVWSAGAEVEIAIGR